MNRARGACSRRRIAAATGTPHLQLLKNFGERELFFTARALLHRQKRLSAIRGAAQHCRIPQRPALHGNTREAITKMKFASRKGAWAKGWAGMVRPRELSVTDSQTATACARCTALLLGKRPALQRG